VLTPLQEDLLRAAFAEDDTAVAAWRRWRESVDWEAHLDREAFRLMPRTGRNLRRLGVDDPLWPRLKGIARRAWYENHLRAAWVQPTLHALVAEGIDLLLVPPGSAVLLDATVVLDPEAPLAFAVRSDRVEPAVRCLWRLGWHTTTRLPRWSLHGYLMAGERLTWRDRDGHALDLLWQWDERIPGGRFPREVWERACGGHLATVPVRMFDAADAVHDVIRQPLAGHSFARIVDCLLLMDAMPDPPDWPRLFTRAAQTPVAPGWHAQVARLHTLLPKMFPAEVAAGWPSPTLPPAMPGTGHLRTRLASHWTAYRKALGARDSLAWALRHLPGYLLARWHLVALHQIPLRLGRGIRYEWREARQTPRGAQ